jgi:transcriptional regulator with XRE-family HTH domain
VTSSQLTHEALKRLVVTHGGVVAFARRAGISAASLSRWLRNPPHKNTRYQRLLAEPLAASLDTRKEILHSVDGDTLRQFRESRGLSIAETASLVREDPLTLTRWEQTALKNEDFGRLHRRLRQLPEALYVSSTALTRLREQHRVSLAEAALALGMAKTSLYRLEQDPPQLVSQYLLDVAATRFPLNAPNPHAGEELVRFIRGAGLTLRALESVCGLSLREARHLVSLRDHVPLHADCRKHLADHVGIDPATPLRVIDGSFIREAREAVGITVTEAARHLGMTPGPLKLAERTCALQPLLDRIQRLSRPST